MATIEKLKENLKLVIIFIIVCVYAFTMYQVLKTGLKLPHSKEEMEVLESGDIEKTFKDK